MSGHSHWSGIKHKKGVADAKRGKVFSKIAKMIMTAARMGGGDPDMNLRLKYAIDKAKAANMPKDNVERAIKKGTGELGGSNFEEIVYEGYGSGGVALMLEILTDNRNRTASEVRKIFEKRGGRLGESGCVEWMFERKALFTLERSSVSEDDLMETALDAGADNVEGDGDIFEVTSSPENFEELRRALEKKGLKPRVAEIARLPKATVKIATIDEARRILGLVDDLEDHEDVQSVFANFDIPDDILEKIEEEAD